jgi:sugar phosphate isomerase/epimerase
LISDASDLIHIHVKEHTGPLPGGGEGRYVFPGEGAGCIAETLADAFASGYAGQISIEPHLDIVANVGQVITDADATFRNYVDYGRRTEALARAAREWAR